MKILGINLREVLDEFVERVNSLNLIGRFLVKLFTCIVLACLFTAFYAWIYRLLTGFAI